MVYGFTDDGGSEDEPADQEGRDDRALYRTMLKRDRRRWSVADVDGDDALNKEEFASFLHPEENEHMKSVVVLETMEDIDKDKDGKISIGEYIGDMYSSEGEEEEPEWVKNEKEQFSNYRDKNHDGFMDMEEARNWILPPDFDHAEAESRHLIYEADTDADQKLTKYEILEKYDIFVGSQVADFGEALTRHDEF